MKYYLLTLLLTFSLVAYANSDDVEKLWDSLAKAKNYLINNDYRNAETIVKSIEGLCSECNNDSIKVVFLECKAHILVFDKKEYNVPIPILKDVIELYERLNIKSINYLEAFQTIAYCYEKNGNYDEAERFYRKSLIKSSTITTNNQFVSSLYLHLHNWLFV